ncbi:MAG TPA: ABC transporter ATP-binding protein [Bryobacteraceae bacterium]|jgi:ABC-type Fe3+/spermidine/putrescine transport system ATPase subunit|nr:ABC transporter ATP-binding protein [Bryobacteraceae bacterium]
MTPAGPLLSIKGITKRFGATTVLDGITADIKESEFLTVLGESGSGKTTLLRIIAGFEQPNSGELWMQGERFDKLPPNRRNVNTVFQHYALFPHLSVFENVAYGLRAKKIAAPELTMRVDAALSQMKLGDFARRRPAQLSGGQQQRVAVARALVNRPSLLLLDEPLSALDANLRRLMQAELKALQREVGITFLFVTHDQEEAMALSDRIVLLRHGKIEQIDTPRQIYNRPKTQYVATFIGFTNLLTAQVEDGRARIGSLEWPYVSERQETLFSLRPEHIRIVNGDNSPRPGGIRCEASVRSRVFTGASELLELDCGEGLQLKIRISGQSTFADRVTVEISPEHLVPLIG